MALTGRQVLQKLPLPGGDRAGDDGASSCGVAPQWAVPGDRGIHMRTRMTAAVGVIAALFLVAAACTPPSNPGTGPGTTNTPPTAVIQAVPTSGVAPLDVEFSGLSSV